jgi:hypothetical protein
MTRSWAWLYWYVHSYIVSDFVKMFVAWLQSRLVIHGAPNAKAYLDTAIMQQVSVTSDVL